MKKILIVVLMLAALQCWLKDPAISVSNGTASFGYVVEYSGNASRSEQLPMLVALHGNGGTTGNFYDYALDQLQAPARIILLKAPIPYGHGGAWPIDAAGLVQYGDAVNEAVVSLSRKYPTLGKPVLLGYSGGGVMAYYQAATHGDAYSYVFPVSGELSDDMLVGRSIKPGAAVHAFHGKQDEVVALEGGVHAVELLKARRINAELTQFDGGHQGVFTNGKAAISASVDQELRLVRLGKG